jgi:phosphoribosylformylglycinamidine (FGAM) synthase-like enzyme
MSNQKKNLVERLDALEFQMGRVQGVEALSGNLRKSLTSVIEMLNALVEELGGSELGQRLSERLDNKRAEVRRAEAERSEAVLKQLLESDQIEAADVIDEATIVVGTENTPDGKIKGEKLQINFTSFNNDIKAELLGKGVGYVVVRDGVNVFAVEGVYKMKAREAVKVQEVSGPSAVVDSVPEVVANSAAE